jgi:hypothetical protein
MNRASPWKLVATAVALVLVTSLIIATVAWTTADMRWADIQWTVEAPTPDPMKAATVRMGAVASQAVAMSPPPPYAVAACQRQASQHQPDGKPPEALKAGIIGSTSLQPHDERYREAYARCMRSRGYSS